MRTHKPSQGQHERAGICGLNAPLALSPHEPSHALVVRGTKLSRIRLIYSLFLVPALVFVFALTLPAPSQATESTVVDVPLKRGATIRVLLTVPDEPQAGVILLVGGSGVLKLADDGAIGGVQHNFLVRTHTEFAGRGLMTALVDVPSDTASLSGIMRTGKRHANEIAAVIRHMKAIADVPVWLVGTSMGSISAASIATQKQKLVSGLVLTSSVTRPQQKPNLAKLAGRFPEGVMSLPLEKFAHPVLVVWHARDECGLTPAKDGPEIARRFTRSRRVETLELDGGQKTEHDVCAARSYHGFLGVETQVVDGIADFILD